MPSLGLRLQTEGYRAKVSSLLVAIDSQGTTESRSSELDGELQ
jgi:hypothetical protein